MVKGPKASAGSGRPLCFSSSSLQPHAFTCISSSSMKLCGPYCYWSDTSLAPPPSLCGSAAVCCPLLLSCIDTDSSPLPDWLVQLSVAPPSSCVDPHSDWFVQLSLVLDLTMWPRLSWHHMVPSSARDRPAHSHLPVPANHMPWSTKLGAFCFFLH